MNPDIVECWAMPDFTDRQEYMFLITAINNETPEPEPEPEYWEGPK